MKGEKKALHVVRDIRALRALIIATISNSFKFWIYCLYFVSLGPEGVKLLLFVTAKTCVEPENMCMSKDGNSVYD